MKKAKKIVSLLLGSAMALTMLSACTSDGQTPSESAGQSGSSVSGSLEGASIEIATQLEGATLDALKETVANFEEGYGDRGSFDGISPCGL